MIIRNDQINSLREDDYPRLIETIRQYLRDNHQSAVMGFDDEQLRSMIRVGIKRAEKYEMNSDAGFGAFVAIMFEVAPNFDEHPNIKKALMDKTVSPNSRILDIIHRTTEKDWDEAEQSYDPEGWKS